MIIIMLLKSWATPPASRPDRLHLLGLADLLLGPPALGEVLHVDRVVDHPAVRVLDGGRIDQRGEDHAVAAQPLGLPDLMASLVEQRIHAGEIRPAGGGESSDIGLPRSSSTVQPCIEANAGLTLSMVPPSALTMATPQPACSKIRAQRCSSRPASTRWLMSRPTPTMPVISP